MGRKKGGKKKEEEGSGSVEASRGRGGDSRGVWRDRGVGLRMSSIKRAMPLLTKPP